jgi:hypothetical protein
MFDKIMKKFSKNLKWYDISLLKLCVVFFTLFLITVWPAFKILVLSFAWYWYLIIGVILAIPLIKKMF